MFEAFITNLGRYNEGRLNGEWLKFPSSTEDVQALLKRIHIDGVMYEEIFITDYDSDIPGLCKHLGEYESIDELNYFAAVLDDMEDWDVDKFSAVMEFGEHTNSLSELINLAKNLDCYDLYPGVDDEEDLGRYYIEEMGSMEVSEHLEPYIDYEAYGRDMDLDGNGRFVNCGYVVDNGNSFIEHYADRDDIPDEHRIFAYPEKASIRDTLKDYKQMLDGVVASSKERPAPVHDER